MKNIITTAWPNEHLSVRDYCTKDLRQFLTEMSGYGD